MIARTCVIFAAALLWGAAVCAQEERGMDAFQSLCAGCHQIGEGAEIAVGPVLTGVVGRDVASTDFDYSDALRAAGGTWSEDTLDAFLTDPDAWAPGTTMGAAVEDADTRADLISFLRNHTGKLAGFSVSPEILAIEGDVAYGEYLAGECSACHRAEGQDDEIPSITGWEPNRFVTALHAYREGAREHPVMQMIASRLGDEEIASLAAYFAENGN